MINKTKTLIVITGITGSGKSTLAVKLANTLGIKVLSYDKVREALWDEYGFSNNIENHVITEGAENMLKLECLREVRKGNSIILKHSFSKKWQPYLDYVCREYGYRLVIVNCVSRSFKDIWKAKIERDFSSERHEGHLSYAYRDGKMVVPRSNSLKELKKQEKKNYKKRVYTSLSGNALFTDENVYSYINSKIEGV